MNLIVASPWWLVGLLMIALAAAALEDAVRLRISNVTCAAIFVCAIAAIVMRGLSLELWQNAAVFVTILTIGAAAFSQGWFGGGDVKLLAAIGLWLDLRSAAALIVAVMLAGGVLAIGYIGASWVVRTSPASKGRGRKIPYGIAVVVGSLFVFVVQLSQEPVNSLDKLGARPAAPD